MCWYMATGRQKYAESGREKPVLKLGVCAADSGLIGDLIGNGEATELNFDETTMKKDRRSCQANGMSSFFGAP